jgi:PAS domain S-box-containing protein
MIGQDLLAELTPEGWGRAESGEARLVRRDGQTIWVKFDSSPITDEAGNHAGLITVLLDITERRSAEERLRRSEELLQEAQDLARIGSWERDFRTGVFTGSAALYRIFGTTVAELSASRGLKLDLVHPRDRERVRATIEAAIAQRQPYYLDFQLDRPGEVQFVHTRGRVICDEDGTPLRTVGIVQDVTE